MVYFLNSLLQTDKPQEQVARVIKSCNGTELILAHFKESPWRRLTFPFKTSSGDLWVSCEFSGLGFSEASSSKMSLPHFISHFVHFVSFLSLAVFSIWSLSLPLSLFYILKLSASWQRDNREAKQHVERTDPQFHGRVQHTRMHWHTHVSIIPLC